MTTLLPSKEMPTWPPAKTWDSSSLGGTTFPLEAQASADEEVHESRTQISDTANIRKLTVLRSVIKALVMLVAFTLPLFFNPVRVKGEVRVSFQTFYDPLGAQRSWIHTRNYVPNISHSERLHESLEHRFESLSRASDDAFARPSLEYRGWVDVEETANSLLASGSVSVEGDALPTFSSKTEFKLSNTHDSLDSDSDNPEERIEEVAPTFKTESQLARLTVYWPEEGDYYTVRRMSSSGVHLRDGHCAVDPKVIPYGSVVKIPGLGEYVAVDTGSAVVSRRAARVAGRTSRERNALVVDIYCSSRSKARVLQANAPDFAVITWYR